MTVGIIGAAGNMAAAIVKNIIDSDYIKNNELCVYDINTDGLIKYENCGNVTICKTAKDCTKNSNYIFLLVKPNQISDALLEIKSELTDKKIIVSNAAGTTIDAIKKDTYEKAKVIRVMPNTPMMVGIGASGLCKSDEVSDEEFRFIFDIYNNAGVAIECAEEQINTVTAISGSGSAYVFKFAEAVCREAEELGLPYEKAITLFTYTLSGAAKMINESDDSVKELISKVTSPGGTTLAALNSLDSENFDKIIKNAVKACKNRADELGSM